MSGGKLTNPNPNPMIKNISNIPLAVEVLCHNSEIFLNLLSNFKTVRKIYIRNAKNHKRKALKRLLFEEIIIYAKIFNLQIL